MTIIGIFILLYLILQLTLPIYLKIFHDLPLMKLKDEVIAIEKTIKKKSRREKLSKKEVGKRIRREQREIKKEIKHREYKRKITLDWIKLFIIKRD